MRCQYVSVVLTDGFYLPQGNLALGCEGEEKTLEGTNMETWLANLCVNVLLHGASSVARLFLLLYLTLHVMINVNCARF